MPFVMGRFSERSHARKLIFIPTSFSLLTAVSISYALISNPTALIFARIFEGIGWAMLWPALEAALISGMSWSDGKKALSIFNFTWSGSASVGPLVGSAMIYFTTIRDAFFFTAIILALSAGVNLIVLFPHGRGDNRTSIQENAIVDVSGDKESKNDGNDDDEVEFAEPIQSHPWVETEQKGEGGGGEEKRESRFDSKIYKLCTALAAVSSGVLYTLLHMLSRLAFRFFSSGIHVRIRS